MQGVQNFEICFYIRVSELNSWPPEKYRKTLSTALLHIKKYLNTFMDILKDIALGKQGYLVKMHFYELN